MCRFEPYYGIFITNPAWRIAKEDETPGQLEPQLENNDVKTHVIDLDTNKSFCGRASIGDKAITLDQARDPDSDLYFDCEDCYSVLNAEDHNGSNKQD